MSKIEYILYLAGEKIKEKEERKGIKREILLSNPVEELRAKKGHKAYLTPKRLFFQKIKLKILDFEFMEFTYTELLRQILEEEIALITRRKKLYNGSSYFELLPLPCVVVKGHYLDVWKVDISACFYSIYSRLGIDCFIKYERENDRVRVLSFGRGLLTANNSDFIASLRDEKALRNKVYGLTIANSLTIAWADETGRISLKGQYFRSKTYNNDLHNSISALLNSFLLKLREKAKILYWNVDGGIIQTEDIFKVIDLANEYGFNLKITPHKEAHILGYTSYRVDNAETIPYLKGFTSQNFERVLHVENEKSLIFFMHKGG